MLYRKIVPLSKDTSFVQEAINEAKEACKNKHNPFGGWQKLGKNRGNKPTRSERGTPATAGVAHDRSKHKTSATSDMEGVELFRGGWKKG